jgi:hypothetical protein
MKLTILLLAFIALSAFAAESKHDKDVRECREAGDAAIATAKLKHPLDATKVKTDAENKCLRSRGYATGTIRAK